MDVTFSFDSNACSNDVKESAVGGICDERWQLSIFFVPGEYQGIAAFANIPPITINLCK